MRPVRISESLVLKAFIDIRSRAHQMRSRPTSNPRVNQPAAGGPISYVEGYYQHVCNCTVLGAACGASPGANRNYSGAGFHAGTVSPLDAINAVIAAETAANRREADIQMRIARELPECGCDGQMPPDMTTLDLQSAYAAVRSCGSCLQPETRGLISTGYCDARRRQRRRPFALASCRARCVSCQRWLCGDFPADCRQVQGPSACGHGSSVYSHG